MARVKGAKPQSRLNLKDMFPASLISLGVVSELRRIEVQLLRDEGPRGWLKSLGQESTELMRPKSRVHSAEAQELGVCSLLDDAAVDEHDEAVHAGDRREAVRDGDHSLAMHEIDELFLDRALDAAVERGSGLVQKENRGVLEEHPRDGDPLPLAPRQLDASLPDVRLVAGAALPVLQSDDELACVRAASRGFHGGIGRAGSAVADIRRDGSVQERCVLRDHAHGRAQTLLGHAAEVLPIDQDASVLDLVEAQ